MKISRTPTRRRRRSLVAAWALPGPLLAALYVVLLLAPLGLAWREGLPPRAWQDELSSALALVAFAGLLVEFVLSGRFRLISGRIGIDTTMRLHQVMARFLTVAVLLHPFLYVTPAMPYPYPWDPTRQFTVELTPVALIAGLVAWLALAVLVLLAIFREQRRGSYEAWRLSHGIAAAVVALSGTLHTITAGRYSGHDSLAAFWLVLLAVALFTLLWVYALKPALQLRDAYEVRSVRPLALKTWELVVAPRRGRRIDFLAGQFVWLNVASSPFSLRENPFSIASAPAAADGLAFVIKEVGDFTDGIGRIAPGTAAYVDGPHGSLTVEDREAEGIALIAGGVGIAPLLGILRQLRFDRDPRPIVLVYGNRLQEQIVHADELAAMQAELDLRIEHVLGEPPPGWKGRTGVVDAAVVEAVLRRPDAARWLYVLCGPLPMIESVEKALLALGVPGRRIVSERFHYD